MNAAEHYAEAERILNGNIIRANIEEGEHDYAADRPSKSDHREDDCEGLGNLAAAQVHATLATIPDSHIAIYEGTQRRLVERLTEDDCLAAFRAAWVEADLAGKNGDRVRAGMTAAIKAALL